MERKRKIQWHQGFYSGMELELNEYRDALVFDTEHELSRLPLQIDMLVIRKDETVRITNPIGAFFKGHNVIEYKSPNAEMSIDEFFKAIGYACIYKGLGKTVDEIPVEEMTVTLVRHSYPRGLIGKLKSYGVDIKQESDGIFYLEGLVFFSVRIIVTSMLPDEHVGLKMLSRSVGMDTLFRFIDYAKRFKEKGEKELINSILEVSTSANKDSFELFKEDTAMGEALRELMREEIEESENRGIEKGIEKGIEQGIEQGIEKGIEQGIEQGVGIVLEALVKDGTITIERAREIENQRRSR